MLVRTKLKLYLVNILSDNNSSDDIIFFHNFLELSYIWCFYVSTKAETDYFFLSFASFYFLFSWL